MKKPTVSCVGGEPLNVAASQIEAGEYCIPIEGTCIGKILLKTDVRDQFVELDSGKSLYTEQTLVQKITRKNILIELI